MRSVRKVGSHAGAAAGHGSHPHRRPGAPLRTTEDAAPHALLRRACLGPRRGAVLGARLLCCVGAYP